MTSLVEDIVNRIRDLSSRKDFEQLNTYLNEIQPVLYKNQNLHDTILETLNIEEHSLGVLHIMWIKLTCPEALASMENLDRHIQQIQLFSSQCCKEQLLCGQAIYISILHLLTQELCNKKIAIRGISLLRTAIQKIQTKSSQLTSLHADLCQLCLLARCFKPALQFLDVDISEIAKENGMMTSIFYLSYYHYGGMIYTALKNFERAIYFFEQAITCPAGQVSKIMQESYKKHLLVSLLVEGKPTPVPKYVSPMIWRWMRTHNKEYHDLANAYQAGAAAQLNDVVRQHHTVFMQDSNMGLVNQVVKSLSKRNIQKLTKTFITLSLDGVITRAQLDCNVEEVEQILLEMIEDGQIFAGINQRSKMINFYDDPEQYNSSGTLKLIDKHIEDFMTINGKVQEMTEAVMTNPAYLQKMKSGAYSQDEEFEGSSMMSTTNSSMSRTSLFSKLSGKGN